MNTIPMRYLVGVLFVSIMMLFWKPGEHAVKAATTDADSSTVQCKDEDGDGYGLGCAKGPDCNDWNSAVNPGVQEVFNFRDDDCDTIVDNEVEHDAPPVDQTAVIVEAGAFTMGSDRGADDERPVHQVFISEVIIDRNEVTNGQYEVCVAAGACQPPALLSSKRRKSYYDNPDFAEYPVIFVNWHQAVAYCDYMGGRLPTEAEWEKAARGISDGERFFPWGDAPATCAHANFGGVSSCVGDTDRVGRRPLGQSPYGLMDMAGNVWEWVSDWYDAGFYDVTPLEDPEGPIEGRLKVMRGGCWVSGADSLRVSCRKAELPRTWAANVGFRCAYERGE